ncbi:MAG TPA: preprotein translocase subunit SecE [bacterium]|jgi:preprotein translocase subunit SecE|nr:preprotein translocase subunit SecE [Dictyoglomota bacterium]HHV80148.1 preprotein translocase subunit SecE [bacterium]HOK29655.1 preprotein translocase subunit SecE [bacterium]HOL54948.1 preprotein translocase subunit SecE [bacterium]HON72374.1 preprotein translocase subunit SecE [bacterium]
MQLSLFKRIWQKIKQFFREVRSELRKVTWPSRDEVKVLTIIVVLFVAIFTAFIGVVDLILSRIVAFIAK